MAGSLKKKIILSILGVFLMTLNYILHADLTSLAKNDPYPVFSSAGPVIDRFLLTGPINKLRNEDLFKDQRQFLFFSVSAFGQFADRGRNVQGESIYRRVPVQLGDLIGRWSTIGLMYGPLPLAQKRAPQLQQAREELLMITNPADPINDPANIDPNDRFGFFSIPLDYRKTGVRFSLSASLGCGFGVNFEGGVASINQVLRHLDNPFCRIPVCQDSEQMDRATLDFQFIDLTDFCTSPPGASPNGNDLSPEKLNINSDGDYVFPSPPLDKKKVQTFLTRNFVRIANEIELDITNFCAISADEIRMNLFWAKTIEYNRDSFEWAHFLIIPYFMVSGSVSPGQQKNEHKAFAPIFGNNKHPAIGGSAGLSIDFATTFQVGAEVGLTHFLKRNYFDLYIPTSRFQSGVFPYFTEAEVRPGTNTHFAFRMLVYHFVDNLSFHLHYHMIEHKPDTVSLIRPDPAFLVGQLEKTTAWRSHLFNLGTTYEILPNLGFGFLWQAPVIQRNAYRSSTLMFSVYAFF